MRNVILSATSLLAVAMLMLIPMRRHSAQVNAAGTDMARGSNNVAVTTFNLPWQVNGGTPPYVLWANGAITDSNKNIFSFPVNYTLKSSPAATDTSPVRGSGNVAANIYIDTFSNNVYILYKDGSLKNPGPPLSTNSQ